MGDADYRKTRTHRFPGDIDLNSNISKSQKNPKLIKSLEKDRKTLSNRKTRNDVRWKKDVE